MLNMEKKSENCNEFDRLYADLCNSLRKMGKAASFCQLIKNATSDLDRIAILNKDCNIMPSLIKTVKKCRKNDSKDPEHARLSLEAYYAKRRKCSESIVESDNLFRLLNSALAHLSIDKELTLHEFENFECNGIMALENLLVDGTETSASDENLLLCDLYRERANCFYDIDAHEMTILESLRAVHYAKFDKNNPNEQLFSLLYRMCTSLRHLGHWQAATNVVQFSIKLLRSSHLDNAEKSVETIRLVQLLKDIQKGSTERGDSPEKPFNIRSFLESKNQSFPKIFRSISDTLVNTSSSLQLEWQEDRGRHLIATETIPPGSTLIVEHPFSWIVNPNESLSFCQNCCRKVENVIPCNKCSTALFCSVQCHRASDAYHPFECEFINTLTSSEILGDMALLCYRTISKVDFRLLESHIREFIKVKDFTEQGQQNEQLFHNKFVLGLSEELKLDPSNYSAVFAQTPNTDERLGGDLLKRSFSAIILTVCLRLTGYFKTGDEIDSHCNLTETEELIASLFLRHLQSASCNAYGINAVSGSDPRRLQVNEVGGATYPIISTTNHSCNSNVYRFTVGKTCILKALREIRCGEEILDSYGPHFASSSIDERNRLLKGQYMFTCCCSPCTENWLMYSQLPRENPCLKCTKCENGVCVKKKDKYVCSECASVLDARWFLKTVSECVKHYQAAKELLLNPSKDSNINYDKIEHAIVSYANILGVTQKWPCQVLIECQETLKLCWNLQNCF